MKLIRQFLPKFLKDYDRELLLRRPALWENQIHTIAFWGVLLWAFGLLLGAATPLSPKHLDDSPSWMLAIIAGLPGLILFGMWVQGQRAYQTEQGFGLLSGSDARLRFLCYVATALICFLPAFLPSIAVDYRLSRFSSPSELRADIDVLNEGQVFFPIANNDRLNFYKSRESQFADGSFNFTPFSIADYGLWEQRTEHAGPSRMYQETAVEARLMAIINAPDALNKVESYLAACEKYLEPYEMPRTDASNALARFQADSPYIYDYDFYIYALQRRLQHIQKMRAGEGMHVWAFSGYGLAFILLFSVFIGHSAFLFRSIGLKQGILAVLFQFVGIVVAGLFSGIVAMAFTALVPFSGSLMVGFLPSLFNTLLFFVAWRWLGKPVGKWAGLAPAFLATFQFQLLYLLTLTAGLVSAFGGQFFIDANIASLFTTGSFGALAIMAVYAAWGVPFFHRFHLKQNAKPSNL